MVGRGRPGSGLPGPLDFLLHPENTPGKTIRHQDMLNLKKNGTGRAFPVFGGAYRTASPRRLCAPVTIRNQGPAIRNADVDPVPKLKHKVRWVDRDDDRAEEGPAPSWSEHQAGMQTAGPGRCAYSSVETTRIISRIEVSPSMTTSRAESTRVIMPCPAAMSLISISSSLPSESAMKWRISREK